jgi:hypothetical protein
MKARRTLSSHQLILFREPQNRYMMAAPVKEELLNALADLLLEALGCGTETVDERSVEVTDEL